MIPPKIIILAVVFCFAMVSCADGTLEVQHGTDTANGNNGGSPDVGPEDTNDNNTPECCTPDTLECVSDDQYRECDPIGDFCGNWTDPLDCPAGQTCNSDAEPGQHPCQAECSEDHPDFGSPCTVGVGVCEREGTYNACDGDHFICDAEPGLPEEKECNGLDSNCDGEVDSQGICDNGSCDEDQFGPENHGYQGAPDLDVGDTLDDLVLCDNDAEVRSQNWFSLGETQTIDVVLEWEESSLELDIHLGSFPQVHADAGTGAGMVTYQETLEEEEHVFVRVRYSIDDKPSTGAPYSISRPN